MKLLYFTFLLILTISMPMGAIANVLSVKATEKKVAIVIGNSDYKVVTPLNNTLNDANGILEELKNLDFEVVTSINDTGVSLLSKIEQFTELAKTADVVLFYYAGHGAQKNSINYLIPIDYGLSGGEPVDFNLLVQAVQSASPRSAKIFIVDACRNLPGAFAEKFGFDKQRGLARVELPKSGQENSATGGYFNIIAFSTAVGETASDGQGKNSPYAESLIKFLPQRGIEVAELFRLVAADVLVSTNNVQRPEFLVQTSRPLYFAEPIITECDKLAVEQENYLGLPGIPFEDVNPATAVPACENAVKAEPSSSRLKNNLGRAYERAGRLEDATRLYEAAHQAGNVQATNALGVAYIAGCGLPAPRTEEGVALLVEAKMRGSRDALASLTAHDLATFVDKGTLQQVAIFLAKNSYLKRGAPWSQKAQVALQKYQRDHELALKGLTIETLYSMKLHGKLPKGFKCH